MKLKWTVIEGNPIGGFTLHGPFDKATEANKWAEDNLSGDCWISQVESVDDEETTLTINGRRYYDPANWTESEIRATSKRLGDALDDLGDANSEITRLKTDLRNLNKAYEAQQALLLTTSNNFAEANERINAFYSREKARSVLEAKIKSLNDQIEIRDTEIRDLKDTLRGKDIRLAKVLNNMNEARAIVERIIKETNGAG